MHFVEYVRLLLRLEQVLSMYLASHLWQAIGVRQYDRHGGGFVRCRLAEELLSHTRHEVYIYDMCLQLYIRIPVFFFFFRLWSAGGTSGCARVFRLVFTLSVTV